MTPTREFSAGCPSSIVDRWAHMLCGRHLFASPPPADAMEDACLRCGMTLDEFIAAHRERNNLTNANYGREHP